MTENALVEIVPACRHDIPAISALARDQLPDMTYLHDEESWQERARLGYGRHPRDTFTAVARQGDSLLGFFWVDAAPADDHGVAEPWWCINAMAVRAEIQGRGLGQNLAKIIKTQAERAGITTLYGTCYPSSASFWQKAGFTVGRLDQDARSDKPVSFSDGRQGVLDWQCESGNHLFLLDMGRNPAGARLTFV